MPCPPSSWQHAGDHPCHGGQRLLEATAPEPIVQLFSQYATLAPRRSWDIGSPGGAPPPPPTETSPSGSPPPPPAFGRDSMPLPLPSVASGEALDSPRPPPLPLHALRESVSRRPTGAPDASGRGLSSVAVAAEASAEPPGQPLMDLRAWLAFQAEVQKHFNPDAARRAFDSVFEQGALRPPTISTPPSPRPPHRPPGGLPSAHSPQGTRTTASRR